MSEIVNLSLPEDEPVTDQQMMAAGNLLDHTSENMQTEPEPDNGQVKSQEEINNEEALSLARERVSALYAKIDARIEARESGEPAFAETTHSRTSRPKNGNSPVYTLSGIQRGI